MLHRFPAHTIGKKGGVCMHKQDREAPDSSDLTHRASDLSMIDYETMIVDYLLGEYEIEKLNNRFKPALQGEPCPDHQITVGIQESMD